MRWSRLLNGLLMRESRGGIRVFDEPGNRIKSGIWRKIEHMKPKIRFSDKNREFKPENPVLSGFSEHSKIGFIKMSLTAPPLTMVNDESNKIV